MLGGLCAVVRTVPKGAGKYRRVSYGFWNRAWTNTSRLQLERELLRVFHSELPAMAIQYELQAVPVTGFKGLVPITGSAHTGNIMHTWNVHEWEML
jgi:hypothetical protein